jgi:2'-5' RNA ligase
VSRPGAVFLAFEVPADVRSTIVETLGRLPDDITAAWTLPRGWHVTVAWLDHLDAAGVDRVGALVDGVVDAWRVRRDVHAVAAGGGVREDGMVAATGDPVVGEDDAPATITLVEPVRLRRAVVLGGRASPALHDLHRALTTTLAATLGDTLSERARGALERPWRPHVTLARARRGGDPAHVRSAVAARWTASVAWTVDRLALVESHLGGGPARYVTRRTWPFPA